MGRIAPYSRGLRLHRPSARQERFKYCSVRIACSRKTRWHPEPATKPTPITPAGRFALDPSAFGFTNVTDACGAIVGANCSTYEYWDGIHPTAAAHMVIAKLLGAVTKTLAI